jgi:phosphoenolpyruvate synthase/pyruvate phosphate dikinase
LWDTLSDTCLDDENDDCGLLQAIKKTWATVWYFRTFEERRYHSIDHKKVGMALLVHHNFPDEEANGVAVTGNPFDSSGLEPAFYVNVQLGGDAEVVAPPPGVSSDEFLYFWDQPGKPVSYLGHSSLILDDTHVLSDAQILELGTALDAVHKRFAPAYDNGGFYAMDVEFKFDDEDAPGEPPRLRVKQARPYAGRGQ